MAGRIPEDIIAQIKQSADIVDIVSRTVQLKRTGRNFIGLCPFHSEKTPSFTVNPEKQIFHCFGCGTGGNVFSFLMQQDNVTFPEAVRMLAGQMNIKIPEGDLSPEQKARIREKEQLFAANRFAMEFYHQMLVGPKPESRDNRAMQYLKARGITPEIIKTFGLGYAPPGWDNLLKRLHSGRISPQSAEKAGLLAPRKEGGGHYDRFRERIVFPIFDISAQIVGFGGRVMDDSQPKYLNSPETPIYNKRRSLYGLHEARRKCRESGEILVVEGYLDALALHQYGFQNAVATLGTSLTRDHVRILRGFARKLFLIYDSDDAGIKAAQRGIELFMAEEVDARVVVLPKGHDPDSFLREKGADAFKAKMDQAFGIVPFLIESAVGRHGLSVEGKMCIIKDLQTPISAVKDRMARLLYTKELAERLQIDEGAVVEKMFNGSRPPGAGSAPANTGFQAPDTKAASRPFENPPDPRANLFERQIVAMMLQFPESLKLPEFKQFNLIDHFKDVNLKTVARMILESPELSGERADEFVDKTESQDVKRVITALAVKDEPWTLSGCRGLLVQYHRRCISRARIRQLNHELNQSENMKDESRSRKLIYEIQQQAKSC